MIIENTKVLKSLGGKDIEFEDEVLTVGKAIARMLTNTKQADAVRAMILAQNMYSNETTEVNKSDIQFINDSVKNSTFAALIVGQVQMYLNSLKEEKIEKPKK